MNLRTFLAKLESYPVTELDQLSYEASRGYWHQCGAYRYYRVFREVERVSAGARVLDVGAFPFSMLKIVRLLSDAEVFGCELWDDITSDELKRDVFLHDGAFCQTYLDPWVIPSNNAPTDNWTR